jgi:hypothetical protein
MALTNSSFALFQPFQRATGLSGPSQLYYPDDHRLVLVAFGYSMKDSQGEREVALSAAAARHGASAVTNRLEFLKGAWSGTQKFLDAIHQDLTFIESMTK